jgi:hypothetical protein
MPAIRRCTAFALAIVFVVAAFVVVTARPASAQTRSPVIYVPPVDAPVHDPFRAPATPYGPGHRGIEYDTAPGTSVTSSAPGTVAFAGPVAGRRWVTIDHADGVRTTYGPLDRIDVAAGQSVDGGSPIGTTDGRLLFTARVGGNYIDPALLLTTEPGKVRLVPEPAVLPSYPSSSFGIGDIFSADTIAAALSWGGDRAREQIDAVYGATPVPFVLHSVDALVDWRARQEHCTSGGATVSPPPGRRFAILVGGLGSSSDNAAVDDVDTTTLGYDARDVVRFSYAGGRIPSTRPVSAELDGIATTPYQPADTSGDLDVAGRRLANLLEQAVAAAPPSTTVDVYAHSQGGLVVRLALAGLAARNPDVLRRIGVVITLATPNQGAELAGLLEAVTRAPFAGEAIDAAGALAGSELHSDDPALAQLAPGSDLLRRLAAQPPPAGPSYVSIAAQGDAVVPSPDAHLHGAENVIVPVFGFDSHGELPGSAPATREMSLALAGLPPSCESASDAVLDAVWGDLLRGGERFVAATRGP